VQLSGARIAMKPNHCIQATPGYVLGEFVAQAAGAPDAERSATP
jgi:hypothetical protein